jgi:hypothetical protein
MSSSARPLARASRFLFGTLLLAILVQPCRLPAQFSLTPAWQILPGDRSYLGTGGKQRGLAYNPSNDHLLLVDRYDSIMADIYVLDAATGTGLHKLDTSAISNAPGYFKLNMIDVADDGAIYSANLVILESQVHTNTVIHRWANDNPDTPSTIGYSGFELYAEAGRIGDTLSVRGAGTNAQIIMGTQTTNKVVVFTTTNGTVFTPKVITVSNVFGSFTHRGIAFGHGNTFWAKNAFRQFYYVGFDLESRAGHVLATTGGIFWVSGVRPDRHCRGRAKRSSRRDQCLRLSLYITAILQYRYDAGSSGRDPPGFRHD